MLNDELNVGILEVTQEKVELKEGIVLSERINEISPMKDTSISDNLKNNLNEFSLMDLKIEIARDLKTRIDYLVENLKVGYHIDQNTYNKLRVESEFLKLINVKDKDGNSLKSTFEDLVNTRALRTGEYTPNVYDFCTTLQLHGERCNIEDRKDSLHYLSKNPGYNKEIFQSDREYANVKKVEEREVEKFPPSYQEIVPTQRQLETSFGELFFYNSKNNLTALKDFLDTAKNMPELIYNGFTKEDFRELAKLEATLETKTKKDFDNEFSAMVLHRDYRGEKISAFMENFRIFPNKDNEMRNWNNFRKQP